MQGLLSAVCAQLDSVTETWTQYFYSKFAVAGIRSLATKLLIVLKLSLIISDFKMTFN